MKVIIFIFGSAIGSFLNVLTLRLPKEHSILGRSHCPNCRKILKFWELVPIFSFLFLRGRCSNCRKRISWRCPAVELFTALAFLGAWIWVSPRMASEWIMVFLFWLLAAFCIMVFIIDLEHYLILDSLVFPVTVLVIITNLFLDLFDKHSGFNISLMGLAGAIAGILPFYLIWFFSKGRLMGLGDVKLMLPLGLFLGWPGILVCLFIAVFSGAVVGVSFLLLGKKNLKSPLPFGCFLALGAFLTKFCGVAILAWYLSFLGI